jgi:hypothetical protein
VCTRHLTPPCRKDCQTAFFDADQTSSFVLHLNRSFQCLSKGNVWLVGIGGTSKVESDESSANDTALVGLSRVPGAETGELDLDDEI